MKKIDLKKTLKPFYTASANEVTFIDIPAMNFLMIDGAGDPDGAMFQDSVGALYKLAFTMKFMLKLGPERIDYPVMALEGLWWMAGGKAFSTTQRDEWRWTAMVACPDVITRERVQRAKDEVRAKSAKKKLPVSPSLDTVRLERFDEGRVAQIMHIGPYATEPATIKRLHAAIAQAGLKMHGKHHEIYLGDPRRTAPEKLKTILRVAVGKS